MTETFDCIVIGAGITGAATACLLAREGHKVVVVDRYGPAAMASGWTLAGVRQSGRHPAELPLARAAVEIWAGLDEDLDAATHYTRKGNLRLARTGDEHAQMRQMVEDQRGEGLELTFLPDNAAVREIAPALSPQILGASFCPSDGHADPHATVSAFLAAAMRAGAKVRYGEAVNEVSVLAGHVTGVVTDRAAYSAPRVILAAGYFSSALIAPLGVRIPISVRMTTILRTIPVAPVLDQVLGIASGGWAGRQEVDGRFRVSGGSQPWNETMSVTNGPDWSRPVVHPPLSTLAAVVEEMERLLPGTTGCPLGEVWAGLIDMTPDALPVLDCVPGIEGLVTGFGFSGHGFCLGPISGRILAALAMNREPGLDLSAFSCHRFEHSSGAGSVTMTLHG